jgi:hypothetical protein
MNRFAVLGAVALAVVPLSRTAGADKPEDTQPDRVQGSVAFYDHSSSVSLRASFAGTIRTYEITCPGTVVIHAESRDDRVTVTKSDEQTYVIVVQNSSGSAVTFIVKGAAKIVIAAAPDRVTCRGSCRILSVGQLQPHAVDLNASSQILSSIARILGKMTAGLQRLPPKGQLLVSALVKRLDRVREAKSKVLLVLGRDRPAAVSRGQAKYTQWVSITTQLLSEVQQTERALLDLLKASGRDVQELWEAYSGLKEAETRTTRTLIQAFRG